MIVKISVTAALILSVIVTVVGITNSPRTAPEWVNKVMGVGLVAILLSIVTAAVAHIWGV